MSSHYALVELYSCLDSPPDRPTVTAPPPRCATAWTTLGQLLGYWTIGLLGYWAIGLLDYWTIGLLDYWTIGLLDYWAIGLLGYWTPSGLI